MKTKIYKILSIFSIVVFLSYWFVAFLFTFTDFKWKKSVEKKNSLPKTLFVSDWKLFTPPSIYDQRLYYIFRQVKKISISDTLELLGNISIQKQLKAPFNQKELIIDYLVNKNVFWLLKSGWETNRTLRSDSLSTLPSDEIQQSMLMDNEQKNSNKYLSSLFNFGLKVLKEHRVNLDGKEIKIVIKQKIIKPFEDMHNKNLERTETTVFESPFTRL